MQNQLSKEMILVSRSLYNSTQNERKLLIIARPDSHTIYLSASTACDDGSSIIQDQRVHSCLRPHLPESG